MPIGNNKLEHGYPYEPMSIWSQQSHECCKKYYMKLECACNTLDINDKAILSRTNHKVDKTLRKNGIALLKKDVELSSPLIHGICSSMCLSYVPFNDLM
jgi:hypothetical protein